MESGSVVSPPENLSDSGEGRLELCAEEKHHHLAGMGDFFFPPLFYQIFLGNAIKFRDSPEDILHLDRFFVVFDELGEDFFRVFERRRDFMEFTEGDNAVKSPLQLADVLGDVFPDEADGGGVAKKTPPFLCLILTYSSRLVSRTVPS